VKGQLRKEFKKRKYAGGDKKMLQGEIADESGSIEVVIFHDEAMTINEKEFVTGQTLIINNITARISPVSRTNAWQIMPDQNSSGSFKIEIGI
jgi:hypothetical protein